MTVDNVTQILNKILWSGDKWEKVMGGLLDIPESLRVKIHRRYSTDTGKNHACADYYANCHPEAKWEDLIVELYHKKEFALARESKSIMSTGKNSTTILYHSHCTIPYTVLVLIIQTTKKYRCSELNRKQMNSANGLFECK